MHQVNVEEAKTRLPDLIDAAVGGEEIVITRDDQPVVRLVPVARAESRPRFGSAEGMVAMSDDFDAPLEDFDEYVR